MKKIEFLGVIGALLVGVALPAAAGPRGGGFGGGGHFSGGAHFGGGRVGGFVGGGSRAAPGFYGGSFRGAPAFRGSYYTGRTISRPAAAPRYYYDNNRMTAVQPRGLTRSFGRPASPGAGRAIAAARQPNRASSIAARNSASRVGTANRQSNRAGSIAGQTRASTQRASPAANRRTTANREAFVKNHATEHHNGNWHRDWDRHHAHFHNHKVFVFVNGFWWGLDPGIYPSYAYDYPYDSYDYPYDNSGYNPYDYYYGSNPYEYYNYSPYNDDNESGYAGQSTTNPTVTAAQSELSKLGYYNGAIDGAIGDQTEDALARYQEDNNLSVTGTLDTATLQSLGVK